MAKQTRLTPEQQEEIEERRRLVREEQEAAARAARDAMQEHERAKREAEERRRAAEPTKEFADAVKRARERAEAERVETWRSTYDREAKRRNADEALEKRWRERNAETFPKHLKAWADFQEAMAGSDENAKREATRAMAQAWREKEESLIALAVEKKKKGKDEAAKALLAEATSARLEALEKSREAAQPKPAKKKRPAKKKKD